MHPNPTFRKTDTQISLDFARERAFGTLAISADPVPLMSHIPFVLAEDGQSALLHLVRSNPIARLSGPQTAKLVVTGPDAYISPDWYEIDDQVPTWNYVSVHLTGTLEKLPQDDLVPLLEKQSAFFEDQLAPKPPWTLDKTSGEVQARFLRMILPFRFTVNEVESTWKLGQNKEPEVRATAAEQVTTGVGSELGALAELMREPPKTS